MKELKLIFTMSYSTKVILPLLWRFLIHSDPKGRHFWTFSKTPSFPGEEDRRAKKGHLSMHTHPFHFLSLGNTLTIGRNCLLFVPVATLIC